MEIQPIRGDSTLTRPTKSSCRESRDDVQIATTHCEAMKFESKNKDNYWSVTGSITIK